MNYRFKSTEQMFKFIQSFMVGQNEVSFNKKTESYSYYGDNGNKCPIGCLIKNEFYSEEMEGKSWRSPIVTKALYDSGIDIYNTDVQYLIYRLSDIHNYVDVDNWNKCLFDLYEEIFCLEKKYADMQKV